MTSDKWARANAPETTRTARASGVATAKDARSNFQSKHTETNRHTTCVAACRAGASRALKARTQMSCRYDHGLAITAVCARAREQILIFKSRN